MQPKHFLPVVVLAALIIFGTLSYAQPGNLNASFGEKGLVKQGFNRNSNTGDESFVGIANLANGKSLIALTVLSKTMLIRMHSNGTIDSTYGSSGYSEYITSLNSSLAIASDGSAFVAGFRNNGFSLVHFNANGTLDRSFGDNGVVTTYFNDHVANVQTLSIQPDGKILLSGFLYNGASYDIALARYNKDGSLDASFGSGGKVTTDFGNHDRVYAAAIQDDGKILVSGTITISSGTNHMFTVRYHANGSLDTSFGAGGKAIFNHKVLQGASSVKVQPNGNILVAGGEYDFMLLRYTPDGSPDLTFGNNGIVQTRFASASAYAYSIELQEDGRIILGGNLYDATGKGTIGLVRYDPIGKIDDSFGNSGKAIIPFGSLTNRLEALNIQQNGKITAVGSVRPDAAVSDYAIFRFESSGVLDKTFGNSGQLTGFVDIESSIFNSIAVQKDQKIVAGGSTAGVNDADFALARYHLDGTLDLSFGTGGKVVNNFGVGDVINALTVLDDGKILAAGDTRKDTGSTDFILARYHADGSLDHSFGQNGRVISSITPNIDDLNAIAIQDDGKILAGGLTASRAISNFVLARYHPEGSLDSSFGQSGKVITNFGYANSSLVSIKVLQSGKILTLATARNANNSITDILLAQYNRDGSLNASFGNNGTVISNFNAYETGLSMEVQPDGKIIVGGLIGPNGSELDFVLIRYNADGSHDLSFGDGGKVNTNFGFRDIGQSLSIQPNGKITLTGFSTNDDGQNYISLARYNPRGTLDSSFGQNGKVITDLNGDESVAKSIIIGNNLYVAGSVRQLSTYASIASYVLRVPVQLSYPTDVVMNVDQGSCSAVVSKIDPIITPLSNDEKVNFKLTGATTGSGSGSASGLKFNKGITTVTYSLAEDTATAGSFTVTINDTEAPKIINLTVNTSTLWPANHKMQDVVVSYTSTDNCSQPASSIIVTSNEQPGDPASGNNLTDWEVVDEHLVRLRAERSGTGDDRIYLIKVTSTDGAGNAAIDTITVRVPKKELNIKVHSNPSPSSFTLKFSGVDMDQKATLRVMNSMGKIIEIRNNVTLDQTLQIGSSYNPGLYFIELIQGNYKEQVKVIKQ